MTLNEHDTTSKVDLHLQYLYDKYIWYFMEDATHFYCPETDALHSVLLGKCHIFTTHPCEDYGGFHFPTRILFCNLRFLIRCPEFREPWKLRQFGVEIQFLRP